MIHIIAPLTYIVTYITILANANFGKITDKCKYILNCNNLYTT